MQITPETPIEHIFRIRRDQTYALRRLHIDSVRDLLFHFPSRYTTAADIRSTGAIAVGEHVLLYGTVRNLESARTYRKRIALTEGELHDGQGSIKLIWFNQPYIAKMLPDGAFVRLEGVVQERKGELYIANPEFERISAVPEKVGSTLWGESGESWSLPVYPESKGITSKWFHHAIKKLLTQGVHEHISDPLPEDLRKKLSLPSLSSSLVWIHQPQNMKDVETARKRFAFEELFVVQLTKLHEREALDRTPTYPIPHAPQSVEAFIQTLPFTPTKAQKKVLADVAQDLTTAPAMSRLVEGDVGSGKTIIAGAAAYAVAEEGLQAAYMAPTSILATQHFETFTSLFSHTDHTVALLTAGDCRIYDAKKGETLITTKQEVKRRAEKKEISTIIGTHALIQKSVKLPNLALAIIDEQHRFGINQRKKLADHGDKIPHLLSMSATPIPRTLALAFFGDLDISIIDEMPPGRQKVETSIVAPDKREKLYREVRKRLEEGRQAYVICPRVDEPDPDKETALYARSVAAESERLSEKVFPEFKIGTLHGRMKPQEKEEIMRNFLNHEFDILVTTSVVEVGVNVPNATVIIIEGAERFGLSQLHQLRGRVQRGEHKPYCFLLADTSSDRAIERLSILATTSNGFELAEEDLKSRGPGELIGRSQSGFSDIAMQALKNIKMLETARTEAKALLKMDPELDDFPPLQARVQAYKEKSHFE